MANLAAAVAKWCDMLSKREVGAVSKDLEKHCDQIFSAVTDDPKQVSNFSAER